MISSKIWLSVFMALFLVISSNKIKIKKNNHPAAPFHILSEKYQEILRSYDVPCPTGYLCPSDGPQLLYEPNQDLHSDWYLAYQGMNSTFFVHMNTDLTSEIYFTDNSTISVPIWNQKSKCLKACEDFYNEIRKVENKFTDWECDYTKKDFNRILNLNDKYLYWNCYLYSTHSRSKTDKENKINQMELPSGKDKILLYSWDVTYQSFNSIRIEYDYVFDELKYCNWFCGTRNKLCSVFHSILKSFEYNYVC